MLLRLMAVMTCLFGASWGVLADHAHGAPQSVAQPSDLPAGSPQPSDKTFGPYRFTKAPLVYYTPVGTYEVHLQLTRRLPSFRPGRDDPAAYIDLDQQFIGGVSFDQVGTETPCYENDGDLTLSGPLRHPGPGRKVELTLVVIRTPKAVVHMAARVSPLPPLAAHTPPPIRGYCKAIS